MGKRNNRTTYLICLLLVVLTLTVYWQVRGFGFVVMDDSGYVQTNRHVLGGITPASLAWAMTTSEQSNWHPLTWISLMADAQLGKGNPGVFHLTNLVLHLLNTLLLFAFLRFTTGYRWRSAAVAALFAIHPLHVESVAWISERKDVLSTFFWLLTMLAYAWYVKQPNVRRYLPIVLAFALGLMAKPMLVSLPLALILIDIWPVKRAVKWNLILEKIPLFMLAAVSCLVTFWAQSTGGSVVSGQALPIDVRASNALVAYVSYIIKMFCPLNLVMIYPHPGYSLPAWQVVGSGVLLAVLTFLAMRSMRTRPYITVGWLWYLLTLVPVIGLVQVGLQSMADRYTYVPLIGLFIILAWGIPDLLGKLNEASGQPASPILWPALGCVLLAGLIACTYFQVGYWRDSVSLCEHALAVDANNYMAHKCRADTYASAGNYTAAVAEYGRSIELAPNSSHTRHELGTIMVNMGLRRNGATYYSPALRNLPSLFYIHGSIGALLLRTKRVDDAIWHFNKALESKPNDYSLHNNLGCAYRAKRDYKQAIKQFEMALKLDPGNRRVQWNLNEAIAAEAKNPGSRPNPAADR